MSRWKTAFSNQQLAEKIQESLQSLESFDIQKLSESDLAEFTRLLKVLKILKERLAGFDPELVHLNTFGNWSTWATNAQSNIRAFVQNRSIGNLHQANSNIDEILNTVRPIDAGSDSKIAQAVAEGNTVLYKKIVEDLRKQSDEVKAEWHLNKA